MTQTTRFQSQVLLFTAFSVASLGLACSGCGSSSPGPEYASQSASSPSEVEQGNTREPSDGTDSARPEASEVDSTSGSSFGVSDAETQRFCAQLAEESGEEVEVLSCAFRPGGLNVPNGRIDVIEMEYADSGHIREASVLVRTPDDPEGYITTLVTAMEEPGMTETYTLGELTEQDGVVTIGAEFVATTYPNTGDPDEPTGEYEERAEYEVRCTETDGYYDCELESRDLGCFPNRAENGVCP